MSLIEKLCIAKIWLHAKFACNCSIFDKVMAKKPKKKLDDFLGFLALTLSKMLQLQPNFACNYILAMHNFSINDKSYENVILKVLLHEFVIWMV